MSETLTLYTNPMSRGRIARWMLEEVGAPYETQIVGYGPAMKTPAFLAINPMGKVPVITHGHAVVSESAAICAYLADAFPEANLAPPAGDPARGAYYRWLFFGAGPVEQATTNTSFGFTAPEGGAGRLGYGTLEQTIDVLEYAVSQGDYLAGDDFSAADVYLGSQIGWGLQFKSMEPRPAFVAYWKRLETRPAYLRAKAVDDALMPAK